MLPEKLKDDCIVEALSELRFDADEPPEVVVGRLVDRKFGASQSIHRLPSADIPQPILAANPDLRFQPWYEIRADAASPVLRLGPRVISCHRVGRYVGWDAFKPELTTAFSLLFSNINAPAVRRIGLRYVNAFVPSRHKVADVHQLQMRANVGNQELTGPMLLHFVKRNDERHQTSVRIASPEFASGIAPETSAVVDVDVHTPEQFLERSISGVMDWIEGAHTYEKQSFFELMPADVLAQLVEA